MLKERKELEEHLINTIKNKRIKSKRKAINQIVENLHKYDIEETVSWINQPKKHIPELDTRELFLLTEQIYEIVEEDVIKPELYFTQPEMKKSRQFSGKFTREDELTFPLTLDNFIMINHNTFLGKISGNLLAKMSLSRKLHYNYDVQREAVFKRIKSTVIRQPKINMQNILEIKDNLKNKKQKHTQIVLNAALGSAEGGENEIIYDPETMKLTITRGTILDEVDGHHRIKATEMCYVENGNVDFEWIVLLSNWAEEDVKIYQGQLAKQTPIAKERRDALLGERKADRILEELISKSELNGKVSQISDVHTSTGELVAYSLLAQTIDEQFKSFNLDRQINVYNVTQFLIKYFNFLLGAFEDEFLNNPNKYRDLSLINHNNMIGVGYVVLARRLMQAEKDPSEIMRIMGEINFSKDNPDWINLGIINEKGNITDTPKARKAIKEYFENIEI